MPRETRETALEPFARKLATEPGFDAALATLPPRDETILRECYGIGAPMRTIQQIADGLGVSVPRTRNLLERVILRRLPDRIEKIKR